MVSILSLAFRDWSESAAVKKAIAKGIQDGFFGYCSGSSPVLGSDGKYQVPLARVRFNTVVSEDEIDLESGFLIMPQAVPVATPPPTDVGAGPTDVLREGRGADPTPAGFSGPSTNDALEVQKSVEIAFSADRDQLFSAWNAIANLADLRWKS